MANLTATFNPKDHFILQELTKIVGRPSRPTIALLKKEIKANARCIHSTRGTGNHGHLHLCYDLAVYNALPALAAVPWVDPAHPGAAPVIPPGATGPQIQRLLQEYGNNLTQWQVYTLTDQALLHQCMQAIDDTYYQILEDPDEGYADLELFDLLEHLDDTYGDITPDDLALNEASMDAPWSPEQPLEDLFNQVRKAQDFARPHDPISDLKAIRSITTNLENSGVFTDALKKWRARPAAEKTWANLNTHMTDANKERLRSITSTQAGYSSNNATKTTKTINQTGDSITLYYCWTHGYGPNANHTSATCKNRHPKHRADSTVCNMLGGCNMVHRRKGERAIWTCPERPDQEKPASNATIATDNTTVSELTDPVAQE